jgi:predicted lipoprotein
MIHVKKLSSNKIGIALALSSVFYLSACGEDTTITNGEGFNKNTNTDFNQGQLVIGLIDNVITPTYQQFSELASSQKEAVTQYCNVEKTANTSLALETKLVAQESWRSAMNGWQLVEMMQLEPLLKDDGVLRNNIYSWPTKNSCGVDLDVSFFKADSINGQPYDITKRTPSRKSLVAVEYLLFNDNLVHSCTGTATPVDWNNQSEQYRKIARCEFAVEVTSDIQNNAQILLTDWLGVDGNSGYAAKLKSAGKPGSEFATEHDAVNKLSDALFYFSKFTKDAKLAKPLGLFANNCGTQACSQEVESTYAEYSLENIVNNLQALKMFMQGGLSAEESSLLGFNDYLIDVGDSSSAETINKHLALAIASTQSYQESLAKTLDNDPDKVMQTHDQVKKITDKLKSDFITSLALELPKTAAGDND